MVTLSERRDVIGQVLAANKFIRAYHKTLVEGKALLLCFFKLLLDVSLTVKLELAESFVAADAARHVVADLERFVAAIAEVSLADECLAAVSCLHLFLAVALVVFAAAILNATFYHFIAALETLAAFLRAKNTMLTDELIRVGREAEDVLDGHVLEDAFTVVQVAAVAAAALEGLLCVLERLFAKPAHCHLLPQCWLEVELELAL